MSLSAELRETRREHQRRALRARAVLLLDGQPPHAVHTRDVSPGGVGLVTDCNIRPGTACRVRIQLVLDAEITFLELNAKVIYCALSGREGGFKVGLQFTQDSAAEAAELARRLRL